MATRSKIRDFNAQHKFAGSLAADAHLKLGIVTPQTVPDAMKGMKAQLKHHKLMMGDESGRAARAFVAGYHKRLAREEARHKLPEIEKRLDRYSQQATRHIIKQNQRLGITAQPMAEKLVLPWHPFPNVKTALSASPNTSKYLSILNALDYRGRSLFKPTVAQRKAGLQPEKGINLFEHRLLSNLPAESLKMRAKGIGGPVANAIFSKSKLSERQANLLRTWMKYLRRAK